MILTQFLRIFQNNARRVILLLLKHTLVYRHCNRTVSKRCMSFFLFCTTTKRNFHSRMLFRKLTTFHSLLLLFKRMEDCSRKLKAIGMSNELCGVAVPIHVAERFWYELTDKKVMKQRTIYKKKRSHKARPRDLQPHRTWNSWEEAVRDLFYFYFVFTLLWFFIFLPCHTVRLIDMLGHSYCFSPRMVVMPGCKTQIFGI